MLIPAFFVSAVCKLTEILGEEVAELATKNGTLWRKPLRQIVVDALQMSVLLCERGSHEIPAERHRLRLPSVDGNASARFRQRLAMRCRKSSECLTARGIQVRQHGKVVKAADSHHRMVIVRMVLQNTRCHAEPRGGRQIGAAVWLRELHHNCVGLQIKLLSFKATLSGDGSQTHVPPRAL